MVRPTAFEEMLLKMVTSSILRAHISQLRRVAGAYQFGTYHEGGAPVIAWKTCAKMAAEPTKVFIAFDIKNGFGAARRRDAIDGAKRWCPVLGTVFANLWAGKQEVQPTAWTNTPKDSRPITVRDELLQGACEPPVAFALALRVALAEFDEEMRKQGVGWTTELEYWAYVDDITIATTAEFATFVMTKLRETLGVQGLELRKDKLHDVGCHIIHNACCEAGLMSQREVVVPALVTDRLTEPRVDVDAWGHPGQPHMRLDFTVVDAEALHHFIGHEKSAGCGTRCSPGRENEGEQIRENERRSWRHGHSYAAQRAVRPGTGRISPKACGVQEEA